MKKESQVLKVMSYGFMLFFLLNILSSCKKSDPEPPDVEIYTIDITDAQYSNLQYHNSSVVIAEKNLIVANWEGTYACALNSCSYCSSSLKHNNLPTYATWICTSCASEFGGRGEAYKGLATMPLKVCQVSRSGNILTIKIPK